MTSWLQSPHADPGRMHAEALIDRVDLERAREQVAGLFGARPREVVFTSGATEAIAMASWGVRSLGSHQVLTAVEHSAVHDWAARGDCSVVPVDRLGRVDPDAVAAAITPDTALVHVQAGNHEVGTTQDIEAVAAICTARGVLLHVDAAQAGGRIPLDLATLGADLLSLSAHKLGGPPGTGALLVRRGLRLDPLLVGGDQERARRGGMENLLGAVGFGAACAALAGDTLGIESANSAALIDAAIAGCEAIDGVERLGDPRNRLPHIACFGIADIEPQAVLLGLDRSGIAVHSGSACSSESLEPSPVLEAMGVDAQRSLRISTGWSSTQNDVAALLAALPEVINSLRRLR
jgi:cysteine desulfurase